MNSFSYLKMSVAAYWTTSVVTMVMPYMVGKCGILGQKYKRRAVAHGGGRVQ